MQIKSPEIKVKNTCDQLIAWGFCCSRAAEFLVKKTDSPEYAIMCGKHKTEFEKQYPNKKMEFHIYSQELNEKFADQAQKHWSEKKCQQNRKRQA